MESSIRDAHYWYKGTEERTGHKEVTIACRWRRAASWRRGGGNEARPPRGHSPALVVSWRAGSHLCRWTVSIFPEMPQ